MRKIEADRQAAGKPERDRRATPASDSPRPTRHPPCSPYPYFIGYAADIYGLGTNEMEIIELQLPRGDLDGDGDVDITDYSAFPRCFRGPGQPIGAGCEVADLDRDGAVDLMDFASFQDAFAGPLAKRRAAATKAQSFKGLVAPRRSSHIRRSLPRR